MKGLDEAFVDVLNTKDDPECSILYAHEWGMLSKAAATAAVAVEGSNFIITSSTLFTTSVMQKRFNRLYSFIL
jgi:hypothetical protein